MTRRGPTLLASLLVGLCTCPCACRDEPEPSTERRVVHEPAAPGAHLVQTTPDSIAYLEGALIEASYDTTTLAYLAASLPRPSRGQTPLIDVFGAIVDALLGDAAERLEAIGLQPDARIELSIRALDGRAGSVRKLLRELADDPQPAPELVDRLHAEARCLGVHLRASIPTSDRKRLLRALETLTVTDDDKGVWAEACDSLRGVSSCSARPRVLLWTRPDGDDRLRVDAVYLFHDGATADDLARALARVDEWPARSHAPELGSPAPFDIRVHAEHTLTLLQTEALADAALAFEPQANFDYHAYLDRELALNELVPDTRVLDGLDLDMRYDAPADQLTIALSWLARDNPRVSHADMFAPVIEGGALPVLEGDCAMAQACARVAGVSSFSRFVELAVGPFSDSTGAGRILRQAGDRGLILLGLASWPNLLGTGGKLANSDGGLLSKTQATLLQDSLGLGLMLIELGEDPAALFGARYVAYLRVGTEALDALRPAAKLAGLSLEPITIEGSQATIERGSHERMPIYFVDESKLLGGRGGWVLAADSDARVDWLLDTPREPREAAAIDPLAYVHVASLGPVAAHERVSYTDDPPVRKWLDGRSLELRGRFGGSRPTLEVTLGPRR